MDKYFTTKFENLIPLEFIANIDELTPADKTRAKTLGFGAKSKEILIIPAIGGEIAKVYVGTGGLVDELLFGSLATKLPLGDFEIVSPINNEIIDNCLLFFALGAYEFTKYKPQKDAYPRLFVPPQANFKRITSFTAAIFASRDLINTPASDMGPQALGNYAKALANTHEAEFEAIIGDELIVQNYPLIHAVGRAAHESPRLCILKKPKPNKTKVAIIGKGVTFDTGGLNLKPSAGIGLMKKDMGGAACALAAFDIVAGLDLDIDLSLYLPIVENAVSASSMRPSDVIISRKGISVEIDNTDAEGRLILADALTRACEDGAQILIDFATLTGAARVALGPDLPPLYSNNTQLCDEIMAAAKAQNDPLWNMPLWGAYDDDLESKIADMKNGGGAFAGSITAALFLQKFVNVKEWAHLDVYCWNPKERPARPFGGEVQGVRAIVAMLEKRFAKTS